MTRFLLSFYDKEDFRSAILKENFKSSILKTLEKKNFSHITILFLVDTNKVEKEDTFPQEFKAVSGESSKENPYNEDLENFLNKYMYTDRMIEVFKREFSPLIKQLKNNIDISFKKVITSDIFNTDDILKSCTEVILDSKKVIEKDYNEANKISKGKKKKNQSNDKFVNKKGYITILLNNNVPSTTIAWSCALLSNHNIEIQLMSNNLDMSPKSLTLPFEFRNQIKVESEVAKKAEILPKRFDILCHIYSKDKLSFYLSYKQFEADKHIVFYTGDDNPHKYLKQLVGKDTIISTVKINTNRKSIEDSISKHLPIKEIEGKTVGFNVTEGNTIVGAGILFFIRKYGFYSFSYDYDDNNVINLESMNTIDSYSIEDVDEHINVNLGNLTIKSNGRYEDQKLLQNPIRKELAENIYNNFNEYQSFYRQFPSEKTPSLISNQQRNYRSNNGKIIVNLSNIESSKIIINNKPYMLGDYEDSLEYLKGKWFEEYVFYSLLLLKEEGLIKDIRINFEIQNSSVNDHQEFDIVFTDGKFIYIVECKSGEFKADHIYKLEKIVNQYGGPIGKGIIINIKNIEDKTHKERIKETKKLYSMHSNNFIDEIKNLIKFGYANT